MLIYPIYTKDKNLKVRKWFYGDASFQRANNEKKETEFVFPIEIVFEGIFSSKVEYGYAIGK